MKYKNIKLEIEKLSIYNIDGDFIGYLTIDPDDGFYLENNKTEKIGIDECLNIAEILQNAIENNNIKNFTLKGLKCD